MEEIINRVVNSITLAIFGIILWSLLILSISKLRKKEIKRKLKYLIEKNNGFEE